VDLEALHQLRQRAGLFDIVCQQRRVNGLGGHRRSGCRLLLRLRLDWLLLLLSPLLRLGLAGHVGERRGVRACCQREDEHEQREALLLHLEGFSRHEDRGSRRGAHGHDLGRRSPGLLLL
jgi:hypothetical protein